MTAALEPAARANVETSTTPPDAHQDDATISAEDTAESRDGLGGTPSGPGSPTPVAPRLSGSSKSSSAVTSNSAAENADEAEAIPRILATPLELHAPPPTLAHFGGQGFPYAAHLCDLLRRGAVGDDSELFFSSGAAIAGALTNALDSERDCLDTNSLERFMPTGFDEVVMSSSSTPRALLGADVLLPRIRTTGTTESSSDADAELAMANAAAAAATADADADAAAADVAVQRAQRAGYLASAPVSSPMILLSQMAHLCEHLDEREGEAPPFTAAVGHSQGAAAAIVAATSGDGSISTSAASGYARCLLWSGVRAQAATMHAIAMQQPDTLEDSECVPTVAASSPSTLPPVCMAAVSDVTLGQLRALLARVNAALPPAARLSVLLQNAGESFVVGGGAVQVESSRLIA
jgi:malonyl CoA-acyl carrier protein transacylase